MVNDNVDNIRNSIKRIDNLIESLNSYNELHAEITSRPSVPKDTNVIDFQQFKELYLSTHSQLPSLFQQINIHKKHKDKVKQEVSRMSHNMNVKKAYFSNRSTQNE